MRFTSEQRFDGGVLEREFVLGEIPGVLWTPGSVSVIRRRGAGSRRPAPGVGGRRAGRRGDRRPARRHVLLQWDDEGNDRQLALDLFDAFGSQEKTLHATLGGHTGVPQFAGDAAARFLTRHLM